MTLPAIHPSWCSQQRCDTADPNVPPHGGLHRSEAITADLAVFVHGRAVRVTSAHLLREDVPCDSDTCLVLETTAGPVFVPIRNAAGLLAQLSELAAASDLT